MRSRYICIVLYINIRKIIKDGFPYTKQCKAFNQSMSKNDIKMLSGLFICLLNESLPLLYLKVSVRINPSLHHTFVAILTDKIVKKRLIKMQKNVNLFGSIPVISKQFTCQGSRVLCLIIFIILLSEYIDLLYISMPKYINQ